MKREKRKEPPEHGREQRKSFLNALETDIRKVLENTQVLPSLSEMSPEERRDYSNTLGLFLQITVLFEKIEDVCNSEHTPEKLADFLNDYARKLLNKQLECMLKLGLITEAEIWQNIPS